MNIESLEYFSYTSTKVNKSSIIYNLDNDRPTEFATQNVRIEKYQGYSNAYSLKHYYRLKDQKAWHKSTALTGLFMTLNPNVFYGDTGKNRGQRSMLFVFSNDFRNLSVYLADEKLSSSDIQSIVDSI